MALRSIPPRTTMRDRHPMDGTPALVRKQRQEVYYTKKPAKTPMPMSTPIKTSVDEVQLDLFEEGEGLKVIGDFPGIENANDLVVQVFEGKLTIVTMPKLERKYQALAEIAEGLRVKSREIRNGVMTLILR